MEMRSVGRLVFRGSSKNGGLFIGCLFKTAKDFFKPNHVYEIQEIMGEVFLKDMGPSILTKPNKRRRNFPNWNCSINDILESGAPWVLTQKEYDTVRRREQLIGEEGVTNLKGQKNETKSHRGS